MAEDWKAARSHVWLSAGLKAFTVTMWIITLVALGVAVGQISHAHADVLCEHRGEAHAAQQHTTREADSRWHVEHGQLPTCDLDKHDDHQAGDEHHDDENLPGHRDHEGFHCYHLHCG